METMISDPDRKYLLSLARETIIKAVEHKPLPQVQLDDLSPILKAMGASFVTLTKFGNLRGCIGSLEAHQSLVKDIQEHAVQAALEDYRFPPVTSDEIESLHIEISRLTAPVPLHYDQASELPLLLHPGSDGVILKNGFQRATFLPQVWEQLPDADEFLSHLCSKMGATSNLWRQKILDVSIYHVEMFEEE